MACVLIGVGLASAQDAVVEYMSPGYPAYETLLFRCVGSLPVIALVLSRPLHPSEPRFPVAPAGVAEPP